MCLSLQEKPHIWRSVLLGEISQLVSTAYVFVCIDCLEVTSKCVGYYLFLFLHSNLWKGMIYFVNLLCAREYDF